MFVYSSGRRYGAAPRVWQVLQDGSVRVGVCRNVTVVQETVQTFANMDEFIATLGSTTKEPTRKLRRRKKNGRRKQDTDT